MIFKSYDHIAYAYASWDLRLCPSSKGVYLGRYLLLAGLLNTVFPIECDIFIVFDKSETI